MFSVRQELTQIQEQRAQERSEERTINEPLVTRFEKGQTGKFGNIEVTVASVDRSGQDEFEGEYAKRTLLLNIKNVSPEIEIIHRQDFRFEQANGRTNLALNDSNNEFEPIRLEPNQTATASVVIYDTEYTEGTKLRYEERSATPPRIYSLGF